MLRSLQVRNFAIIDEVDISFNEGMTVLTGETGAGKSILVDALSLVMGERGGPGLIRDSNKRAEYTADFDISKHKLAQNWLVQQSLDDATECILRRVINADGRSRSFINGNTVNLQTLKSLGELLVDIHGQHFHQSLGKKDIQRDLVDHFGKLLMIKDHTKKAFNDWKIQATKLSDIKNSIQDKEARIDLLEFQSNELKSLDAKPDEFESLTIEYKKIQNIEKLSSGINRTIENLQENEPHNSSNLLFDSIKTLDALLDFDSELIGAKKLLEEAEIQISEATDYLSKYSSSMDFDPERCMWLEDRINSILTISRKHRVEPNELSTLFERITNELEDLKNSESKFKQLDADTKKLKIQYEEFANNLSKERKVAAKRFSKLVTQAMSGLGMPDGIFKIELTPSKEMTQHGIDTIDFLISANPGREPLSIAKIASGGELSRMSLAIQVIASDGSNIPTMIFDEVDSGVGGAVAEMIGIRLRELGKKRQVLCVTHLPQVASQASSHMRINKMTDGKSTKIHVTKLKEDSRIEEIARMLGGIEMTEKTREHASEMLSKKDYLKKNSDLKSVK
ncbi:MAG: DNA repair protein RecN [Pseudomonadota bacterium]|nr:DNA repair protein RecN [Pseudomonadota bacterium]